MIDILTNLNLKELYIPMWFLEYLFLSFWGKFVKMYGLWLEGQCYCKMSKCWPSQKTFKKALQLWKHMYQIKKKGYKYKKNAWSERQTIFSIKICLSKLCPQFLSTPSDFLISHNKSGNSMVSYIPEDPFSSPSLWWMQHYHTCSGTFYIFWYFRQSMSIFLWSQLDHVNTIFLLRYLVLNHRGLNLSILVRLLGHLATEEKLASCSVQYMFWRENTCYTSTPSDVKSFRFYVWRS